MNSVKKPTERRGKFIFLISDEVTQPTVTQRKHTAQSMLLKHTRCPASQHDSIK